MTEIEFECECGWLVVRFVDVGPRLCAGCHALTWITDTAVRESTRAYFIEHEIIGRGVDEERAARLRCD